MALRARDWAIWLTRQPTVTGTVGEQMLPERLQNRVTETPALRDAITWLIPTEGDQLDRACCAVLVRGAGSRTVLLTGHFDTVTTVDYDDIRHLATEPEVLLRELQRKVATPATPAEERAKGDFASGDFLPGRGLLDMKAGLGAGLAALEAFASTDNRQGNLLFVAVPDEEVNSVGARALAAALSAMPATKGINIVAAINLDCIGDDGDGTQGRAVALGSVGKLLLTALVIGQQTHASHPYQGVNAGAMAAALAGRLEWACELADGNGTQAGIPPTLLSIKDSKLQYDVTTPASVFVTWNSLTMGRDANATLQIFRTLTCQALDEMQSGQAERRKQVDGGGQRITPINTLLVSELFAEIANNAAALDAIAILATEASSAGHSLPEQNRILTEAAWRLSGRRGPAVILGLGSLPYPPVQLSNAPDANRLRLAIEEARAKAATSSGMPIKLTSFFPGISDMSFIGEAGDDDIAPLKANTPAWASGVRWSGQVGGVPVVNIGPWGRDYHTPLERLHTPYAFDVLPGFLLDVAVIVLGDQYTARG